MLFLSYKLNNRLCFFTDKEFNNSYDSCAVTMPAPSNIDLKESAISPIR